MREWTVKGIVYGVLHPIESWKFRSWKSTKQYEEWLVRDQIKKEKKARRRGYPE